jgi:hypothetical protein
MPSDRRNGDFTLKLGDPIEELLIGLRFCWFSDDVGIEQIAH